MTPSNDAARSKQISLSARGYNRRDVMIALAMSQQLRPDAERRARKQSNNLTARIRS
jgi:hypothetical protein